VLVLNGDLSLCVWSQPRKASVISGLLHGTVEFVSELESQWQQLGRLISSVAEHDTLVTSTESLKRLIVVKTLCNVRRLLLNGDEDVAGLVVETLVGVIVADVLNGVSDNLLVVEMGLCGDLTEDHDHAGLSGRLASDLGKRILLEAGIEDSV